MSLLACLSRLASLQHEGQDRLALREAAEAAIKLQADGPKAQLAAVARHLHLKPARWLPRPDPSEVPALVYRPPAAAAADASADDGWAIARGTNAQGHWITDHWDAAASQWREQTHVDLGRHQIAALRLKRQFSASSSPVFQLIRTEIAQHKGLLVEAALGGAMINVVALATSFYSMQIYDRVIPAAAMQTLLVLTLGVLAAIAFEMIAKVTRTALYERLIDAVDQRLARAVYLRFLSIRLDQMPQSVGALAGQMRGYETVRGFLTAATTGLLVDAPFALLFMAVILAVAGPIAWVPLGAFILSMAIGLYFKGQVQALAERSNRASNQKTGLLVESVEGAETIKSGQGGWRMLSRWMATTDDARDSEQQMRGISERSQHLTSALQQLTYVLIVALGALLVSRGGLSFGGLIACSILAGRVLAPVAMVPNLLVQWANAKAALQGLDQLWRLQDDHHGHDQPVVLHEVHGNYRLEGVQAQYGGSKALMVPVLAIRAGEKVGVLGPVGAGKTTLLRLLSGMYKPHDGRVLLDDVDLSHLSKPVLAENLGYVQQDGRLFAGTLRENLILGQIDPGDDAILQAARKTGLMDAVIARAPKGLQQEIFEGGTGLSGGQRQLVNLTRAFLRQPRIWLLDEPTASMDRGLELHVTQALKQGLSAEHTLVLVTHKLEMLDLVDRLIVIANHQVALDGPKAQVLARLQQPQAATVQGATA